MHVEQRARVLYQTLGYSPEEVEVLTEALAAVKGEEEVYFEDFGKSLDEWLGGLTP